MHVDDDRALQRGRQVGAEPQAGHAVVEGAHVGGVARQPGGSGLPEDLTALLLAADSLGRPLDGAHRYVLHFDSGQLPPAGALWSLAAYDGQGLPMANPVDRYALGDRDPLQYNADGSLDLVISHAAPEPGGSDSSRNGVGIGPFRSPRAGEPRDRARWQWRAAQSSLMSARRPTSPKVCNSCSIRALKAGPSR